ncbi:MAG: DUF3899 domain-containing protein [Acetatifactor sp.]|nr:DUF3899 domain-containing protein [Acetatifactor sp.]
MKGVRKAFLICLALGAVLAAAVCALNVSRDYGWSRSICDGFFVAAVMLLGSGAIRAVNNRGAFDVAGYGLRTVINLTIPALRREEKEDIYQYRERKKAERKSPAGLFLAGVMYFVLSLVALTVYEFI